MAINEKLEDVVLEAIHDCLDKDEGRIIILDGDKKKGCLLLKRNAKLMLIVIIK